MRADHSVKRESTTAEIWSRGGRPRFLPDGSNSAASVDMGLVVEFSTFPALILMPPRRSPPSSPPGAALCARIRRRVPGDGRKDRRGVQRSTCPVLRGRTGRHGQSSSAVGEGFDCPKHHDCVPLEERPPTYRCERQRLLHQVSLCETLCETPSLTAMGSYSMACFPACRNQSPSRNSVSTQDSAIQPPLRTALLRLL